MQEPGSITFLLPVYKTQVWCIVKQPMYPPMMKYQLNIERFLDYMFSKRGYITLVNTGKVLFNIFGWRPLGPVHSRGNFLRVAKMRFAIKES